MCDFFSYYIIIVMNIITVIYNSLNIEVEGKLIIKLWANILIVKCLMTPLHLSNLII
jgi:hypothetical protein